MAEDLPYLPAVGNISKILTKIRSAGTPPKFTLEFLKQLGFASSQDRGMPRVLKQLGFLDASSVPTDHYNRYKVPAASRLVLADGLRTGWAPIFLAESSAQDLPATELTGVFQRVTGQSESVAKKMASTFRALAAEADWAAASPPDQTAEEASAGPSHLNSSQAERASLSLHHDIHLHLPPTSDVGVYRAIFRALREELGT
jgi:hypothetical protein